MALVPRPIGPKSFVLEIMALFSGMTLDSRFYVSLVGGQHVESVKSDVQKTPKCPACHALTHSVDCTSDGDGGPPT